MSNTKPIKSTSGAKSMNPENDTDDEHGMKHTAGMPQMEEHIDTYRGEMFGQKFRADGSRKTMTNSSPF